ncbi:sugar-binding transcriptional regulator [Cobetia sp. 3AK]|uniref:sugar-binding transcriptional regulator n=1 Tax=unclassified Cobetia TaxID=2609414 RepID=UPI0015970C91|nr:MULTISPECIES: sugar-binding transcriptional regulator [unclassified Cobetia]MDH2375114.1 sugar-binding transcriptional regulator [Cobetia sp. 3AK]
MDKFELRLEQAARAAWLSYVGGRTQDEIATQLGVSRPGIQRLLSLARQERLVKISIDHPVASSMALSDALVERFGLSFCDVVPSDTQSPESIAEYLAVAGAERLSFYLGRQQPQTISLSTGRAVRAAVEALSRSERPQHRIVSLVGNVALNGSSNRYDGVMLLADKIGADRFLLPAPVVAASVEEKESLLSQSLVKAVFSVACEADVGMIGIGRLDAQATLFQDQFISAAERDELMEVGAVGELMGWPLDMNGQLIDCPLAQRITSVPLTSLKAQPLIGLAGGHDKVPAILSALRGGWLQGLIIDEVAAQRVCAVLKD